ncbi:phosphotransferase family protein [Fodinicurvata sediminis]|uniref:phosphotransferase family protein n=1 Tax=Fodinicurvata sediminis TaxID=1121832 RepID=UPI0003B305FB|nr:phosphotransferase family protein [Fodinicurvata sediminis]
MSLDQSALSRLESHLAEAFDAQQVQVTAQEKLSGGAIQENWAVDVAVTGGPREGTHAWVLRTDSASGVALSHSRLEEFALLKAAWKAGVCVPEPIHHSTDRAVLGKDFCLMRRVGGTAVGQKLVKDDTLASGDKEGLAEALGRELARIHTITPATHSFDFLALPEETPALNELRAMYGYVDAIDRPEPALEWALRWLKLRLPENEEVVLAHRDFRTGNYMVDENGLTGILDWEFSGWSDPHEDIGWFCAMCWRFGRRDRPAGGIGSRAAFYHGYYNESGRQIDPAKVYWWEVFAHLRWAVIALQQAGRYLSGEEETLNLGLIGLRLPEIEIELLQMTAPGLDLPSTLNTEAVA